MKEQIKKTLIYNASESIGKSAINHGKSSDRVYIMQCARDDSDAVFLRAHQLLDQCGYSKIIAKVPQEMKKELEKKDYQAEAWIPNFFHGRTDGYFMAYYSNTKRGILRDRQQIEDVLNIAKQKTTASLRKPQRRAEEEIRLLEKGDSQEMAKVYKQVFATYPFPIFDAGYIEQTMDEHIIYYGVFCKGKLVAIASGETDYAHRNVEMTDFATLTEYRGRGYGQALLEVLEKVLEEKGYLTFYTIARAVSYGMNITFSKMGYTYGGRLINNTNIGGQIETMNVWYKHIEDVSIK